MATTTTSPRAITPRERFLARLAKVLHHGNAPLALAVTDLDGFAAVNERHGKGVGDRVLSAWERILDGNLPPDAAVFRLGGDEYAVLVPGASAENALIILDEIRTHFASHEIAPVGSVSASVGVAANPPHGATAEELWRNAGQALMRAKRQGRDRIAIYVEEKMVLKSNYYSRGNLERLAKLSEATSRTEASLLREALDGLFDKYRGDL
jgi:diguanylate cyclase